MKRFGFWVKFLGILLFCFLIYKVGWRETIDSIKKVSIFHVFVGILIFWVAFYLKSLRWKVVSNSYGIPLKSFQAFRVFFIGIFLANITPGKIGDFARLFYIKDQLPSQKIGWSSLIMDRIFDLICLAFFSLIAIVYYQFHFGILKFPKNPWSLLLWIGVLLLVVVIFYLLRNKLIKVIQPWWNAFNSHNLKGYDGLKAIAITCLSMILIYGVFNYMAWVMNISINHLGLFLGAFILGILTLLPITILGIGVRETSLVIIFQLYDLSSQDAIALSLIIFLLQLLSLLPGAIWFYFSPVELSKLKRLE
ncbi:lysylphosphatidylglycerol synthase transmembrane domain-containing protein [Aquimarina mytili]|uniref:Flippase-like domain-containing protein n=1 Tax=Aquimarina mytili TaxID=874423 RepID=A0A937A1M0_9FLAO|nr:lysylphosphatidylglycerol synthase transmembrane domain-containing protein [Aquimarina mytili]MBL0683360.1 flippase-like domain-containing protein [Aquimarina mytili]